MQYLAAWALKAEDFGVDPHDEHAHVGFADLTGDEIEAARQTLPEAWR